MKKLLAILLLAAPALPVLHADTLLFSGGNITRCHVASGYSQTAPLDLSATPYAAVPTALLSYVSSLLASGEALGQVVIDPAGQVVASYQSDGVTPATYRQTLTASCTVISPDGSGQRLLQISSESLPTSPTNLRDSLLSAWSYVAALP